MSASKRPREPERAKRITVLLVEDDPNVATTTSVWLRKLGYDVLVSADGRSACDMAARRAEPIDLLLTDVMLPGMRGPVLAGVVRSRHPEAAVLFSSGYSPELVGELFTSHANTAMLLRKPYTAGQLAAQVQLALERKARGMRTNGIAAQPSRSTKSVAGSEGGQPPRA